MDCTINKSQRKIRTQELKRFLTKHELTQHVRIKGYLTIGEQDTEQTKRMKRAFVRGVIPKVLRGTIKKHYRGAMKAKDLCCCLQEIILRHDKIFYLNRNKQFFDKMKLLGRYLPNFHKHYRTHATQTDNAALIGIQNLRSKVNNNKQYDSLPEGIM